MTQDYYSVLGVARDADAAAIKSAFRKLAMQWHPDQNLGDKVAEEKFKAVNTANQVLSDPIERGKYDRLGHAAYLNPHLAPPPPPHSRGPTGSRGHYDQYDPFEDLFRKGKRGSHFNWDDFSEDLRRGTGRGHNYEDTFRNTAEHTRGSNNGLMMMAGAALVLMAITAFVSIGEDKENRRNRFANRFRRNQPGDDWQTRATQPDMGSGATLFK